MGFLQRKHFLLSGKSAFIRFAIAMPLILLSAVASAQQREFNDGGSASALRNWPPSGVWFVSLIPTRDGGLACTVLTGKTAENEAYVWGVGFKTDGTSGIAINDKLQAAVAGPEIAVIVDGRSIGRYPVSDRRSQNGYNSARSDLDERASNRLVQILGLGGQVKLVTTNTTYVAALQGMKGALGYVRDCLEEARQLSGQ
jgi:hypothetical protein